MKKIIITMTLLATIASSSAQEKLTNKKGGKYEFTGVLTSRQGFRGAGEFR